MINMCHNHGSCLHQRVMLKQTTSRRKYTVILLNKINASRMSWFCPWKLVLNRASLCSHPYCHCQRQATNSLYIVTQQLLVMLLLFVVRSFAESYTLENSHRISWGRRLFLTLGADNRSLIKKYQQKKYIFLERHLQFTVLLHTRRLPLAWPKRKLPT